MINNLSLLNLLHEPVYLILVNRLHFSIDYGGRLINNRVKEKQIDVFHSNGLRDQKIEIQFFCFFFNHKYLLLVVVVVVPLLESVFGRLVVRLISSSLGT